MSFTYEYPRPALSADCVLFGWHEGQINILLVQRKHEPFAGCWALPGGFVDIDEDLPTAAARELEEETHLVRVKLKQLAAYGAVDRDPRTRVVTIAHWGLVTARQMKQAVAGDDAALASWFPMDALPKLAFDHSKILSDAREALSHQATLNSFGKEWLPRQFSSSQLTSVYEAATGKKSSGKRLVAKLLKEKILITVSEDRYKFEGKTYRNYQTQWLPK